MAKIYALESKGSGKAYIGCSAAKLNRRFNEHMSLLRKGKHSCRDMVAEFSRVGRDGFWLHVLETLANGASVEDRRDAELRWMRKYEANGLLYNELMISFEPGPGYKIRSHTAEANEKRRLAQIGKPKGHGAKISATKRALGQRPSREAILKARDACARIRSRKTDEIVSSASNQEDAGSQG